MPGEKRIIATFHPQAWVRNYGVGVDPEGPTTWDVTEDIIAMSRGVALSLEDDSYSTDDLRVLKSAPKWIREWSGPFYVSVAESIHAYFGVEWRGK